MYKVFSTLVFMLLLSSCELKQLQQSKALVDVHSAERKVTLDKLNIKATTFLLDKQNVNLASDKKWLGSAKDN